MSLLDKEIEQNKSREENENVCQLCKLSKNNISIEIRTCENCFGIQLNMALNKIEENIKQIKEEIAKIEKFINDVNDLLSKDQNLSLVVINKAEIDLLNATSTIGKLKIDLETNKKAYKINQIQANKFRKQQN